MKYYPVFLRVAGRRCLVIGGGQVAEHKVQSLLRADAQVTIISPQLTPTLTALAAAHRVTHHMRAYTHGDLRRFLLVYAATDNEQVQAQIADEAAAAGVLLNVADRAELCDFIAPSVLQRGDLLIAASTSGTSPALAKRIRQDLEGAFGTEYDLALQILGRLRQQLSGRSVTMADRQRIFTTLVGSPLLEYVRGHQTVEIDRLLASTVGEGVSLSSLGIEFA
jgi:precorrin-2 dehydrogenase/sirohydrochlorin ferrochelatase